ncbi:hypothetical protein BH10PAT4_BH10PAT4_4730 [soil metagenome]
MNDENKDEEYLPPDQTQDTAAEPEVGSVEDSSEDTTQQQKPDDGPDENPITWSASEFLHGEKTGIWYILFVIVVLGFIALDIFILKSYTFSALVIVMAVALIVYSRRPPRVMQYALSSNHGLYIGEKLYSFSDFKSFGLIKDGEHHSIMLIPTKRFSPGVSVYFPEEAGEEIVDILGVRLPMKPLKLDAIDTIIRKLRL